MVVESFTLINCFYRYVREQMRWINKRDLWKNIFNIVRGSFVPVYMFNMFSFPLVSWLICDVLALFFVWLPVWGFRVCPLTSRKIGHLGWVWSEWRGISQMKKGWGYPTVPKEREKSTGFFFLFSCLFWRERDFDPLVVPVTIMLMHYCGHSLPLWEVLYMLPPDIRRPANWLCLPASPGMHYWLVFEVYK